MISHMLYTKLYLYPINVNPNDVVHSRKQFIATRMKESAIDNYTHHITSYVSMIDENAMEMDENDHKDNPIIFNPSQV